MNQQAQFIARRLVETGAALQKALLHVRAMEECMDVVASTACAFAFDAGAGNDAEANHREVVEWAKVVMP